MNNLEVEQIVGGILKDYPESEWLARCQKALPNYDGMPLIVLIEILSGGDVYEVEE